MGEGRNEGGEVEIIGTPPHRGLRQQDEDKYYETQVREAIFVLQGRRHKTFESGFREKSDNRDQYIGMYNKHINIPDSVIDYFKVKQFEIPVVDKDDRTVVNIHPENANAITLEEWKAVWDDLPKNCL